MVSSDKLADEGRVQKAPQCRENRKQLKSHCALAPLLRVMLAEGAGSRPARALTPPGRLRLVRCGPRLVIQDALSFDSLALTKTSVREIPKRVGACPCEKGA